MSTSINPAIVADFEDRADGQGCERLTITVDGRKVAECGWMGGLSEDQCEALKDALSIVGIESYFKQSDRKTSSWNAIFSKTHLYFDMVHTAFVAVNNEI